MGPDASNPRSDSCHVQETIDQCINRLKRQATIALWKTLAEITKTHPQCDNEAEGKTKNHKTHLSETKSCVVMSRLSDHIENMCASCFVLSPVEAVAVRRNFQAPSHLKRKGDGFCFRACPWQLTVARHAIPQNHTVAADGQ